MNGALVVIFLILAAATAWLGHTTGDGIWLIAAIAWAFASGLRFSMALWDWVNQ